MNHAAELKLRAERRLGEMLREMTGVVVSLVLTQRKWVLQCGRCGAAFDTGG
jgi:hypothetical protein